MRAIVCSGAGFLLAVLWFDLMFDVQVRASDGEEAVASIGRYYRRVTTDAFPMNRLVMVAMLATLGGIVAELITGGVPTWAAWASLLLAAAPVSLAALRTVPNAVRLGAGADSRPEQLGLARSILRDHRFCFAAILAVLMVQLGSAA
ncbi:MAG TPA: hypothetical protein VKJ07_02940 [Mycobacteriales bacterium]|nr:hypothetical protein [Mycobacteriales bacterium]